MTIDVESSTTSGSIYLIVKDRRLASGDTPQSRLASRIKMFAQQIDDALGSGPVYSRLVDDNPRVITRVETLCGKSCALGCQNRPLIAI